MSTHRIRHWCWSAALAAWLLGFSGCASWNLRGEAYREDETTSLLQQLRPGGGQDESFVFSNKARQIENNLGGP